MIKYKDHEIFILDGVEDYLTESAKKYKRNLMATSFAIVTLIYLSSTNENISFTSIFGFGLSKGVDLSFIIITLTIACTYQLVMLYISIDNCKSRFIGQQHDGKTIKCIKDNFSLARSNSEKISKINESTAHKEHYIRELNDSIPKLHNIAKFCEEFRTEIDRIEKQKTEVTKQVCTNAIHEIKRQLEIHFNTMKNNTQPDKKTIENINLEIDNFIMKGLSNIVPIAKKQELDQMIKSYNECNNLYLEFHEVVQNWLNDVNEKLDENNRAYTNIRNEILKFGVPKKRLLFSELYLPLIFGSISIISSVYHIAI